MASKSCEYLEQVRQQRTYTTNAGVQLKLCNTCPLFKGDISVVDCVCLHLSSLLKTITINDGVQCRRCIKKSRLLTNIWLITAAKKLRAVNTRAVCVNPIVSTDDA